MIGPKRNPGRRKTGGMPLLLIAACVPILAAACSGFQGGNGVPAVAEVRAGEKANPPERVVPATPGAEAKGEPKGGVVARAGVARAGEAVAGGDPARERARNTTAKDKANEATDKVGGGEDRSRKLALKLGGEPGTGFSGTCAVGNEEKEIEGSVPERYVFEPGEAGLECEIRKEDGGALKIVVAGEGVRSVQQTGAGESTTSFTLSEGGISSSTSSVYLNGTATSSDGSGNGPR